MFLFFVFIFSFLSILMKTTAQDNDMDSRVHTCTQRGQFLIARQTRTYKTKSEWHVKGFSITFYGSRMNAELLITICHMTFMHKQNGSDCTVDGRHGPCTLHVVRIKAKRVRAGTVVMGWLLSQSNNSPEKHNRPVARANKMTTTMITSNATPTTMPMIELRSKPLSADSGDELMRTE